MAVVERISHRVAVMYLGQIVEMGRGAPFLKIRSILISRKLMAAVPVADPSRHRPRRVLPSDDIPSNIHKRGEETPAVSLQLVGLTLCCAAVAGYVRFRAYNIQTGRFQENNMTQFITHKCGWRRWDWPHPLVAFSGPRRPKMWWWR
ncbi:hypothetical protein KCP70_20580 [Salmonella enterica subsp. enterica]|nr:hypothetical protein KCP70_20580 [Salmonella enterica subsp. enterica]